MARFLICAVLMIGVVLISGVSCGELPVQSLGWFPSYGGEEDVEFLLDSEISRRILATTKFISYRALQTGTVPCSLRGASYYNCRPGASGNPYTRGCSVITRCSRG